MYARAYVLIEVETGQAGAVVAALHGLPGIRAADAVTGLYDVIAVIETPQQRAIGRLVLETIHAISGIKRTITCMAIV
jgi:DNA-binding Lrp family transcriptional regulator